jgi:hypothetical protein
VRDARCSAAIRHSSVAVDSGAFFGGQSHQASRVILPPDSIQESSGFVFRYVVRCIGNIASRNPPGRLNLDRSARARVKRDAEHQKLAERHRLPPSTIRRLTPCAVRLPLPG